MVIINVIKRTSTVYELHDKILEKLNVDIDVTTLNDLIVQNQAVKDIIRKIKKIIKTSNNLISKIMSLITSII